MAKGNKRAKIEEVEKKIKRGFEDFEGIIDDLVAQAEKGSMPLLAQSFGLSKTILTTYKKAWLFKIKEEK